MAETTTPSGKHERADEPAERDITQQHPALAGDKPAEVAARSADDSKGQRFLKTFVVAGAAEVGKDHACHEANASHTLSEALRVGLHPKGEAKLVKTEVTGEPIRGVVSTACTYAVEVEPAVTDTEAHTTLTPSRLAEQKTEDSKG